MKYELKSMKFLNHLESDPYARLCDEIVNGLLEDKKSNPVTESTEFDQSCAGVTDPGHPTDDISQGLCVLSNYRSPEK